MPEKSDASSRRPLPDDLPERLAAHLARRAPAPGRRERAMARQLSPELSYGRHFGPPRYDATPAAVLILLYKHQGLWRVPLTLRSTELPDHAGQISLPGGMIEQDESDRAAALRELEEELGVAPETVRMLGTLSPIYVYASNFRVVPWVGACRERPAFRPNPSEVARLLEPPLADLMAPDRRGLRHMLRRGLSFRAPHICHQEDCIWGATGVMLGELIEVVASL